MQLLLLLFSLLFAFVLSANILTSVQDGQALIDAASYGNFEDVRRIVEEELESPRAPANIQNGGGMALIYAEARGHLDIVRYLAERGLVPANIQNGQALICSARHGHLEVVRYLIEEGPEESRVPASIQNGLALIFAVIGGHLEVIRFLVEGGPEASRAPANIQNGQALISSAREGCLEVVIYLLSGSHDFNYDQCERAIIAANNGQIKVLLEEYQDELMRVPK